MDNARSTRLSILQGKCVKIKPKNFPYRETVGSLLYLSSKTRPDLAYGVIFTSRYIEKPTQERINDVKHLLKYLRENIEQGIEYKYNENRTLLQAYCDADFAGDPETRKSTTGYVIYYAGGPISWCSRKQTVIALSRTKAEYIAAADCCKKLMYLKGMLGKMLDDTLLVELNVDNQSAIALIKKSSN